MKVNTHEEEEKQRICFFNRFNICTIPYLFWTFAGFFTYDMVSMLNWIRNQFLCSNWRHLITVYPSIPSFMRLLTYCITWKIERKFYLYFYVDCNWNVCLAKLLSSLAVWWKKSSKSSEEKLRCRGGIQAINWGSIQAINWHDIFTLFFYK